MKHLLLVFTILFSLTLSAQDCGESTNKKAQKLYEQALDKYKSKATYRTLLEDAVKEDSEFALAYDSLAKAYYSLNIQRNFDEGSKKIAVKYAHMAVELCPDIDPFMYYIIGMDDWFHDQFDNSSSNFKKFLAYEKRTDKEFKLSDNHLDSAEFYLEYVDFQATMFKKPVPFAPRPVDNISTTADEYIGTLTPDNEVFYFTRRVSETSMGSLTGPKIKERFIYSTVQADGKFDKGKQMGSPFNQDGKNQGGTSSTIDNKTLYVTICGGDGNCDIYYSEFDGAFWGDLKPITSINTEHWETQPSVSSDGNTLYFVSDRPGGIADSTSDIYKTVKDDKGEWGKPVNLGPTINSEGNEKTPFFHTDGQTLYFSSNGHYNKNIGGYDIFMAKLDSTGKFQKPKNIGYPINTKGSEIGFFCSTDGKTGYFASDRHKGVGGIDLMQFDLHVAARPEKIMLIKGQLKDDNNQPVKGATVEIKNIDTKQVTKVAVDSITGRYVTAVTLKSDYILTVTKEDAAFTSQYISKKDTMVNNKPKKVDIEVKPVATGKAYTLNDIKFESSSYDLSKQSKIIIESFADYLKKQPKIKVAIHGHTDDLGNDAENMALSDNRAKAVYEYITSLGVDASRLSYKGFGETKPLAPNVSEANRAKNRRTEFVIVAK